MNGLPTIIEDGKLDKENKNMIEDKEWDISFVFNKNSKGYHPDIGEFFKIALDKDDSDKSSQ